MLRSLNFLLMTSLLFYASHANAGPFYIETGFGASKLQKMATFFGDGSPDSTSVGFGYNVTFAKNLSKTTSIMQAHLGVAVRSTSGAVAGTNYGLFSVYPVLRIELMRLYIGGGVSPFIFSQRSDSSGFKAKSGALGLMAEAAILWRIVPYFHLALGASAEGIQISSTRSPLPAIQASFQMRFLFWFPVEAGERYGDFDGWRYPFGIEIWDR